MKTQFIYPNSGTPPRIATFNDETFTCEVNGGKNGDGSAAKALVSKYTVYKQTDVQEIERGGRTIRFGKNTDEIDADATKAAFAKALEGFAHFEEVK